MRGSQRVGWARRDPPTRGNSETSKAQTTYVLEAGFAMQTLPLVVPGVSQQTRCGVRDSWCGKLGVRS